MTDFKAMIEKIGIARKAIVESKKQSGEIPCPVCKTGPLRFSVAPSNKHIHAACSTKDCVRWVE